MEQVQIEGLVNELELRVDRLRALYDQYFMGIEKLEPSVPRKDVERRFDVLRKEQIRNTALRFKFQTILQRYNTYQTFWMRICRQIEEGTYKRHVMRANARFGDDAAKKKADAEAAKAQEASRAAGEVAADDPFDDDEAKSGSIDVSFDLGDIDELGDLEDPFAAHPFPKLPSSRGATAKGDASLSALPPATLATGGSPDRAGAAAATGPAGSTQTSGATAATAATKMRIAPMPSLPPGAIVGAGKPRDERAPDPNSRETERRLPASPPQGVGAAAPGSAARPAAKSEPFFSLGKPAAAPVVASVAPGAPAVPGAPAAPGGMRVAPPRPPMPSVSGAGGTSGPGGSGAAPVRPPLPSSSGVSRAPPPLAPRAAMPSSSGAASSPAITTAAPVRAPMASSPGSATSGPGAMRPPMPSSPTAQIPVPAPQASSSTSSVAKAAVPVRAPLPSAPVIPPSPSHASLPPMRAPQTTFPGVAPPPRQSSPDAAPPAAQRPPPAATPAAQPTPAPQPRPAAASPAAAPAPSPARVAPAAPASPARAAAAPAAPAPAARPPARSTPEANDSEDRTRQLYSQYVETRRKQNEPTNAITYESLATTLKESTQRLKEKHGAHKAVDFEVVVKDGKTILRPIVK